MSELALDLAGELGGSEIAPPIGAPILVDLPGTIGLYDETPIVCVRFDAPDVAVRPQDEAGTLADLDVVAGLTAPAVIDGVTGRARQFVPANQTGLVAADRVSGGSLLTRDLTIQAIVNWSVAAQLAYGDIGTIVCRGKGNSPGEYIAFGLELAVAHAGAPWGELRWIWQDLDGVLVEPDGAEIAVSLGYVMLTATRRWVSPTEVLMRFFVDDRLVGEVTDARGAIGGGTTGTMQVGTRYTGAGYGRFLAGAIDELLIVDREMAPEEIEATWLRITRYQPLGYQLLREMHDPGFPISTDPGSDVQLETRLIGHALGFAAAQAENLRTNTLPTRAYGSVLEDWETAVAVTPQPTQDLDTRRARVLGRLRQRQGSTIPGLQDALVGLVETDPAGLEFLAFDQTVRDDFSAGIQPERWDVQPAGSFVALAYGGGSWAFTEPGLIGDEMIPRPMDGATRDWNTMSTAVGGDGREAHLLACVKYQPGDAGDIGIYFGDWALGNYILLGVQTLNAGGVVRVERFVRFVSQGVTSVGVLGPIPPGYGTGPSDPVWLHLYQTPTQGIWRAAFSITSGTAGFIESGNLTHPTLANLAGCYLRTVPAAPYSGVPTGRFDDVVLRAPYGDRSFNAYVYRNPALAGTADIEGAHSVIAAIRHAFIDATIITSKSLLCDDAGSLYDRGPTGAL